MEQYLLDTGKGKLVITCTTLESDKAASVKVFDAVIRSFRIVRPGDPLERHVETAGGFSFAPPLGWTAKAEPGEAFRVFSGPGFTSIRIRSIPSTGTLSADTDAAVRGFSRASANSLVSRTEFVTDSRAKGNKLVLRTDVKVDALITLMYVFDTGKAKLVFTGAMLESEREDNEKLVDAAVRSLQIGQ
jgi:hypothetical protein